MAKSPQNVPAKLKELKKLARATSRLSLEIFRDIVTAHSLPTPPKPKKVTKGSLPIPPKPKFEALADIAFGAGVIEQSASSLE